MLTFTPREIRHLIIAILLFGFAFGFNDGSQTFILKYWLLNLVGFIILATIVLLIHVVGHKITAMKYNIATMFQLWGFKRYGLTRSASFPIDINVGTKRVILHYFYLGPIITFLVTLFSNGKFFFVPLETYLIKTDKLKRIGHEFITITNYENAKIAFSGVLANLFASLILQIFNSNGIFDKLILMNLIFAAYCMLPLPHLDGIKIFMGSKPLFVFGFSLTVLSLLFLQSLGPIYSLTLIGIVSFLLMMAYIYLRVYKS